MKIKHSHYQDGAIEIFEGAIDQTPVSSLSGSIEQVESGRQFWSKEFSLSELGPQKRNKKGCGHRCGRLNNWSRNWEVHGSTS